MVGTEAQRLADAGEDDAAHRYVRGQLLAVIVRQAIQRADAMSRLDARLGLADGRRLG